MGIKEEYICDRCCQSSDDPALPKKDWRWWEGIPDYPISDIDEASLIDSNRILLCPDCNKELEEWLRV